MLTYSMIAAALNQYVKNVLHEYSQNTNNETVIESLDNIEYGSNSGFDLCFTESNTIHTLSSLTLGKMRMRELNTADYVDVTHLLNQTAGGHTAAYSILNTHLKALIPSYVMTLYEEKILTYETLMIVENSQDHDNAAKIITLLLKQGLVTMQMVTLISSRRNMSNEFQALGILERIGQLTAENVNTVLRFPASFNLLSALQECERSHITDTTLVNEVLASSNPESVAITLSILRTIDLFNEQTVSRAFLHPDIYSVAWILNLLKRYGVNTRENVEAVLCHEKTKALSDLFKYFENLSMINRELTSIILSHPSQEELLKLLNRLKRLKLLTNQHVATAIDKTITRSIYSIFLSLKRAKLLRKDIAEAALNHRELRSLAGVCFRLRSIGSLNIDTLNIALKHTTLNPVAKVLDKLAKAGLLSREYVVKTLGHPDIPLLESAVTELESAGLLNQPYIDDTFENDQPHLYANALALLKKNQLLDNETREYVKKHSKIIFVRDLIRLLDRANLMIADNLNRSIQFVNTTGLLNVLNKFDDEALNQDNIEFLFGHMPFLQTLVDNDITLDIRQNSISTAQLMLMFDLYNQHTVEERERINNMMQYATIINQLRYDTDEDENPYDSDSDDNPINRAQSTHTASVHRSVSASAMKLKKKYPDLDTDDLIKQIIIWGNTLETNITGDRHSMVLVHKNDAVQRAISRISANDSEHGNYLDPNSNISTRELLAIIWHALHDAENRISTLEDALAMFLEGLYECQREYNLDHAGKEIDINADDEPACEAGTFNKIMEKMQGVLPQVNIIMITKQTAALKLPSVVKDTLAAYIKDQSSPAALIEKIKTDDIDVVWDAIKDKVADHMFQEFGSIYRFNQNHPDFVALVASGVYVALDDVFFASIQSEEVAIKTVSIFPSSNQSLFQQPRFSSAGQPPVDNQPNWGRPSF